MSGSAGQSEAQWLQRMGSGVAGGVVGVAVVHAPVIAMITTTAGPARPIAADLPASTRRYNPERSAPITRWLRLRHRL